MSCSALERSFLSSEIRASAAFFSPNSVSIAALALSMAPSASETSSSSPRILSIASFFCEESSSKLRFMSSFSLLRREILPSKLFLSSLISCNKLLILLSLSDKSLSTWFKDSVNAFRSAMSLSTTCNHYFENNATQYSFIK